MIRSIDHEIKYSQATRANSYNNFDAVRVKFRRDSQIKSVFSLTRGQVFLLLILCELDAPQPRNLTPMSYVK
jgi:hypothetical protein